jgi:hypothetical protein
MKSLLKYFFIIILFFTVLIVFFPKEQLFNYAVNKLYNQKIYLTNYKYQDNLTNINIQNTNIIFESINMAHIDNIDAKLFVVYNNIDINNISIDESLNSFVPSTIKNININYNILKPLFIYSNVNSKIYSVKITFDILNMKLKAIFKTSKFFRKKYPKLLRELKYDKNIKDYTYEYKL